MSQVDTMNANETSSEPENSETRHFHKDSATDEQPGGALMHEEVESEDSFAQTEAQIDEEMKNQASSPIDSSSAHDEENGEVKKGDEKKRNEAFDTFLANLNKQNDPEIKLQITIDFMGASISQSGTPNFKNFW